MDKQQLAKRIWESANVMRSKIEANEYKDYILGFIFYKFLSDQVLKLMKQSGAEEDELPEVLIEEDTGTVEYVRNNLGYFISYENLHSTWLAKHNDFNVADVRDALAAFDRLIHPDRRAVFDGIFDTLRTGLSNLGSSTAEQTKAIKKLLILIDDVPTDGKQGYDVLGFIYEYLIEKFAANAGKKAGEFYTPHEVSLIMSQIIAEHLAGRSEIQIYDPTSGSGSLLLNIGQAVSKHMGDPDRIKYFAQELKQNTYNLTRMNLVMRGIKADNIVTRNADSLAHDWPLFRVENDPTTYETLYVDAVVSNPPYSQSWEPEQKELDPRFARFGLAPKSKADYAFLLHELYHVKPDGILTIVLPHGVLFRGGSEGQIRQRLIEENHIDAIIGLPANIFYGTGIATIIMVLRQKRDRDDVLFIDASQGFVKEGKNNQLRAQDIQRIVDAVSNREDIEHFARVVTRDEIRDNDYNLNIPRYVSATLPPEPVDLYATMHGGIPSSEIDTLDEYWQALPGLRDALFVEHDNGYAELRDTDLKSSITEHPSAANLHQQARAALSDLPGILVGTLVNHAEDVDIRATEDELTADLFERLSPLPLIDEYAGFQIFSEQWEDIANDLDIIHTEGRKAVRIVDPAMEWKKKSSKNVYVQTGWEGRVASFDLVQQLYLNDTRDEVDQLQREEDSTASDLDQLVAGLSEEDKTDLSEALNEKQDKFIKAGVNRVVKELDTADGWAEGSPEATVIEAKRLLEAQTKTKGQLKKAKQKLEDETISTIKNLSDEQITEVLTTKWVTALMDRLYTLPTQVLRELTRQIQQLSDKYAVALDDLAVDIEQTKTELSSLIGNLTGSDSDMKAVETLQNLLGGNNE